MLNPKVTWKAGYQPSGELLLKTSIRFLDRLQGEISRLLMSENPIFHLFISLDGGEEAVDKITLEIEINTDKEGKLNRAEVCQIRREYFEQFGYRYSDGTYTYKGALRSRTVAYIVRFKCEKDPFGDPTTITAFIEEMFADSIAEAFEETSFFDS